MPCRSSKGCGGPNSSRRCNMQLAEQRAFAERSVRLMDQLRSMV
jgi:hypothetical protein